jgi:hypothetical protein
VSRRPLLGGLIGLGLLATTGLAGAQPAPVGQPLPPVLTVPPAPPAPAEEAPPEQVQAPAPVAAPPLEAADVAPAAPPKATVAEKPSDEVTKRARYDIAIIQALDKVTAESVRFEAAVGRPVRYKSLIFTVKACERAADDEPVPDAIAYLIVDSQPKAAPGKPTPPPRQAFKGWMYASSPGLNPLQHPVYDAWLITCRATTPVAAGPR